MTVLKSLNTKLAEGLLAIVGHGDFSGGVEINRSAAREAQNTYPPEIIEETAIPSYLHWNPLVSKIFIARLNAVCHEIPDSGTVADLGCGLGLLSDTLQPEQRVVLLDLFPEIAKTYHDELQPETASSPWIIGGDVTHLPLEENSVRTIVAMDVLEHIEDLRPVLTEIERVGDEDMSVIVSGPTENLLYQLGRYIAGFEGDYHQRSIHDIRREFESFGFEVTSSSQVGILSTLFEIYRFEFST